MRRLLFLAIVAIGLQVNAQDNSMWGVTREEGAHGMGSVFKADSVGRNLKAVHHFYAKNSIGQVFYSRLLKAPNGKIYGASSNGGKDGRGVMFEFNPSNGQFNQKADFDFSTGIRPYSHPFLGQDGKVYGVASSGGYGTNRGVFYEYDVAQDKFTSKAQFVDSVGASPYAHPTEVSRGVFYGTAYVGGAHRRGAIYKYDMGNNTITLEYSFKDTMGQYPISGLTEANNGRLYGVTQRGGIQNRGVLYEYNPANRQFRKVKDMSRSVYYPIGGLLEVSPGVLYGISMGPSYGKIYKYDIAMDSLMEVNRLSTSIGSNVQGGFTDGGNGKLYAVSRSWGNNREGTIIEYTVASNTIKVLHHFKNSDGTGSIGDLLKDGNMLYGVAPNGGKGARGTFYSYNLSNNTFKVEAHFREAPNGAIPTKGLTMAKDSMFYGLTSFGGRNNRGVLYQINPKTEQFTPIYHFVDSLGSISQSDLLLADNGKLYGTTRNGGKRNSGVLFEFNPVNKQYKVVANFDYSKTGSLPYNGVIQAQNGKLYGCVGSNNKNTLYEYEIGNDSVKVLHSFVDSTGRFAYGKLTEWKTNKLYGTTFRGGKNNNGVLFEYDLSTNTYTVKHYFDDQVTGKSPRTTLYKLTNGALLGGASYGGRLGRGTLFKYDPSTDSLQVFHLDRYTGAPVGGFIASVNNKIYGYSTANNGSILEYDPIDDTVRTGQGFTRSVGIYPEGRLVRFKYVEEPCSLELTVQQNAETLTAIADQVSYQWINCKDNQPISGATSKVYTATENGDYAVVVSSGRCTDTSACMKVTTISTSIQESKWSEKVTIYPNPGKGQFFIQTEYEISSVQVYSITGELVRDISGALTVDLTEYPKGIYTFKVTPKNPTNGLIYQKVVKQ